MPTKFAVSYKAAVKWFCDKPEHKADTLCNPTTAPKGAAFSLKTNNESKAMYREYCAVKEHKPALICAMSSLKMNAQSMIGVRTQAHAHTKPLVGALG